MKSIIKFMGVVAFGAALASPGAAAAMVDQANTSAPGFTNSPAVGQSFTAGLSGGLTGIEIFTPNSAFTSNDLTPATVSIYSGSGVGGTALASGTFTATATANGFKYDIASLGFGVSAGTQYTFNVAEVMPSQFGYSYSLDNSDSYADGMAFLNTSPIPSWDLGFRTYVDTALSAAPEPASWGLMVVGFGLLGAAARKRRPDALFA